MSTQIKGLLILIVITLAILGLFLVGLFFGSGEKAQSEKPLVICNPPNVPPEQQKCSWTAHIHFDIKVFKGSQEGEVGFEKGDLQVMHTHAEYQKVHWHGLISVDPKTREVNDFSALKVENIPRDFKLSLQGTPKFIVNGKEVNPSYIWKDGDTIEIHYE